MAKRKAALAFAAGFGEGYLGEKDRARRREQEDEDRSMRREDHEARRAERQRAEQDRARLADAARPATVTQANDLTHDDEGNPMPQMPQIRLETAGGVQRFDTQQDAQAAAAAHDAGRTQRIGAALDQIDPVRGQQYTQSATKFTQEQQDRAKKLRDEGAEETARDMLTGDPTRVFETFNRQGTLKLKEPPQVSVAGDLPGGLKNYVYSGTVVDKDGKERPFKMDAHTANMAVLKSKDALEYLRKAGDSESRHEARVQQLDLQAKKLEMQGLLNEARILRIHAQNASQGGGADAKLGREERIRFTTLFTDAGRRMQDVSKTINTLQADRQFMREAAKAGTPQERQLRTLQEEHASYKQERDLYQSLLSQGASKEPAKPEGKGAAKPGPALADVPPKVPQPAGAAPTKKDAAAAKAAVTTAPKADYSNLWR